MPRVISFFVLLSILLIAGAVFFQVMAPFILPLFLAAVLVVVFKPLQLWVLRQLPGRNRLAALLTTVMIMLTVLAPTAWVGWKAYKESQTIVAYLSNRDNRNELVSQLQARGNHLIQLYNETFSQKVDASKLGENVASAIPRLLSGQVVSIGSGAAKLLVGVIIMMLALYYFLADGPKFVHNIMLLSPLEPEYEQELLNRFVNVSRAVVSATLLSAVAQGLLAGIGFYFALNSGAPIFLLMALTMVGAVVPFVGAAGVWIPTCIWIYLYKDALVDGRPVIGDTTSAVALAIYCGVVVSQIDNVIKPWVLHGQSNLHPLLALLSVLGGIAALGPVGILVGPMIVAFVQALLVMINKELALMSSEAVVASTATESVIQMAVGAPVDAAAMPVAPELGAPAPTANGAKAVMPDTPPLPAAGPKLVKRRRRKK